MSDFTLKYRPQKISELSLISIRERLSSVLKSGKLPHAFLFCGPKGTGKTSAARIIAKAVNCEKVHPEGSSRGEPCNKCSQCLSITNGSNLDILEIDAASNRGIDDIRDLREKIKLAPSLALYKVYIIDEVQMLTTEAFNALLKTLEEPPRHAVFILCTTQPEKLPETIISRCMRFNFQRATQGELIERLKQVAKEEKLEVSDEALKEIAKASSGSFRDSLNIIEQASFSGKKITKELISEILDQALGLEPEKLIDFLVKRDAKGALGEINRVVKAGGNLRVYSEQLLETLRILMLAKLGVVDQEQEVKNQELEISEIKLLIEIFSKAALDLKEAVIPQLPLELAVVEWSEGKENVVSQSSHSVSNSAPAPSAGPALDPDATPEGIDSGVLEPASNSRNSRSSTVSTTSMIIKDATITLNDIQSRWQEVLTGVRPRNFSIEALLRATRPVDFSGRVLTLEVFYQFHKDKLESGKCRTIVEEVMSEIFMSPFSLKCVLGDKPRITEITEIKKEFTDEKNSSNGKISSNVEGIDEDIIAVAEEIFNGKQVN